MAEGNPDPQIGPKHTYPATSTVPSHSAPIRIGRIRVPPISQKFIYLQYGKRLQFANLLFCLAYRLFSNIFALIC